MVMNYAMTLTNIKTRGEKKPKKTLIAHEGRSPVTLELHICIFSTIKDFSLKVYQLFGP
jgi:hypothetical protein